MKVTRRPAETGGLLQGAKNPLDGLLQEAKTPAGALLQAADDFSGATHSRQSLQKRQSGPSPKEEAQRG